MNTEDEPLNTEITIDYPDGRRDRYESGSRPDRDGSFLTFVDVNGIQRIIALSNVEQVQIF